MNPQFPSLVGQQFNYLTVIGLYGHTKQGGRIWECRCVCGKITHVTTDKLNSGHSKSCGCYTHHILADTRKTHGETETRLYKVWMNMRGRCKHTSRWDYEHYGGRGIKVCEEWDKNFVAFRDWAMEAGYNPEAKHGECTLDRIDVNGDYCPENCRWVDMKTQMRNTRSNRYITIDGETMVLKDWSARTGVPVPTFLHRLESGWTEEEAILTPPKAKRGGKTNDRVRER